MLNVKNMTISKRIGCAVCIAAAPILYLLAQIYIIKQDLITYTEGQISAEPPLALVVETMADVAAASHANPTGHSSYASVLADFESKMRGMLTSAPLNMQKSLDALAKVPGDNQDSAKDTLEALSTLANTIVDDADMILDPDKDTIYLITAILDNVPDVMLLVYQQAEMVRLELAGTPLSEEQDKALFMLRGQRASQWSDVETDVTNAAQNARDGQIKDEILPLMANLAADFTAFGQMVTDMTDEKPVDAAAFQAAGKSIYEELEALEVAGISVLGDYFKQRISDLRKTLIRQMLIAVGIFIAAFAIVMWVIRAHVNRPLERLSGDFNTSTTQNLANFAQAGSALDNAAAEVSTAARQTTDMATRVAAAANQASVNVQSVSSAVEEMTVAASEIAERTTRASNITRDALISAQEAEKAVQDLNEMSQKIEAVMSTITNIAEQTNLLALNATIEAARAGEAGKGFAVVAGEVKALANQTGAATGDITSQIEAIQKSVAATTSKINTIVNVINEVNETTMAIQANIEQQSAASREVSRSLSEASGGTSEVTRAITEVSTSAARTLDMCSVVNKARTDIQTESGSLSAALHNFNGKLKGLTG